MRVLTLKIPLAVVAAIVLACRLTEGCSGRKVLNGEKGIISDGQTNYSRFSRCEWLIEANGANKTIHLEFESMATECSFDFLFVYDGKSYDSPLIASLSGDSHPEAITATSGYMLLYLFSDRNYEKDGFVARYSVLDCPFNCSGHGKCVNHTCHCVGYYGDACEKLYCPDNCSGHGNCTMTSEGKRCICEPGYVGTDCGLSTETENSSHVWYRIADVDGVKGRTAHTGIFLQSNNCLWIFGGFDLNDVLNDLNKFCFKDNRWSAITQIDPWPSARKGHAVAGVNEGFYIFGGSSLKDKPNAELWYFNTTTETWTLMANNSFVQPRAVTGHTLTNVENKWLYLFGGKSQEIPTLDTIYRIRIPSATQWEQVRIRGGNFPPRRLSGHSTVFHGESRSLIVFGGYAQKDGLESKRTRQMHMFNIEDGFWSVIHNKNWNDAALPFPRAFHSAVILGNYMLVYGGNTHEHHNLEVCYNSDLYLYHLGCHVWHNDTLGYLKPTKGRFGHIASVANGNQLIVMGGYNGRVLSDVLVYKVSPAIARHQSVISEDLDHCVQYSTDERCLSDPDCVYCRTARNDINKPGCVHRTRTDMCKNHNIQDLKSKRCPGICPVLSTCSSCVSQGRGANLTASLPRRRVYNEACSWCVKQAVCQPRAVPQGTCLAADNTASGIQGWWGGLSANLTTHQQCQVKDLPAGLHWIEYRYPMNKTYPDHLSIVRRTEQTLQFQYRFMREVETEFTYYGALRGFIHPLNAPPPLGESRLQLHLKMKEGQTSFYISRSDALDEKPELVLSLASQATYNESMARRPDHTPIFPNIARGNKYYIEIFLKQHIKKESGNASDKYPQSNIKLEWNGALKDLMQQPLTAEFLQPYSGETCSEHFNCVACLTNNACGWCNALRTCMDRTDLVGTAVCSNLSFIQFLITTPSYCPTCDDYVECETCTRDNLCEWILKDGHCTRRYRFGFDYAVKSPENCRVPCQKRSTCKECVTQADECAWCENTRTCLPFCEYVPRYLYGQCTKWIDVVNLGQDTCRECNLLTSCSDCLMMYGCGWCYTDHNPTIGYCTDGDFQGLVGNATCSAVLSDTYDLDSTNTSWAYEKCPDIDECRLGLHDCHPNATCENNYHSYSCECNPGFKGNGKTVCNKACLYECIHGNCSGPPDHVCNCVLGWTGPDCNTDCDCNNHSTCYTGVGICDECQHRTTGLHCELCQIGSYGNPLDSRGCSPCTCNGHGDIKQGICNNETRECYCTDNTKGVYCEHCEEGYYGDPRNGMKCYLRCDDRTILTNITRGALGTHEGSGVVHRSHAYCLWLMTVYSDIFTTPPPDKPVPSIKLAVEGDMEVKCGRHLLYIYDGIPEFISGTNNSATLLGAFCGMKPGRDFVVVAKSGVITVYFEADIRRSSSRGFNASFQINMCPEECHGHRECKDGECVCQRGFGGINCEVEVCPRNCSYNLTQGECNQDYGMCECTEGFVGAACNIPVDIHLPRLELLIDPNRMKHQDNLPPAMMGHTLTSCGDGKLYLFGGISPSEGLQADMWVYEISIRKWKKVLPATDAQPSGRYYHGAACVPKLKAIYVFGGFLASQSGDSYTPTNQLWKYNLESQVWSNITQAPNWVPPLAGHTFTHIEETDIVLIGGFSANDYFSNKVFKYNAAGGMFAWKEFEQLKLEGAFPIGLYGHTAVYDKKTSTIYTFGGYLYRLRQWQISYVIYTFDVRSLVWNLLTLKNATQWQSRVFHASILYNDTMITVGGQTDDGSYASDILVYNTHCNSIQTIPLADLETVYGLTTVAGLYAVREGGANYIMGGFSGMAHGSLTKLIMPIDTCRFQSAFKCQNQSSCSICTTNTTQLCYQNTKLPPFGCAPMPSSRRRGCREEEYDKKHCYRYPTCSQCLARYPGDPSYEPKCKWCNNCVPGSCIPNDSDCAKETKCRVTQSSITKARSCPEYVCPASDCGTCRAIAKHCMWSLYASSNVKLKLPPEHLSTPGVVYAKRNWTCLIVTPSKSPTDLNNQPVACPKFCHHYKNCSACLGSRGAEGGSEKCIWSQTVQECMTPAYLPLHCSFGECGFVIQEKGEQHCPRSCSKGRKCADCVTMPGCGWCALDGQNGLGACLPGGLHKPTSGQCSVENISIDMSDIPGSGANSVSWSFGQCPPENECRNQHDSCDRETQKCIDTKTFYRCQCKKGYIQTGKSCEPVCHQGCDHGTCVRPDSCRCHFGWVGDNCSVECQCNKHSNCRSTSEPSVCLSCQNNTQGAQCQECKEHFVGNPRDGGKCIPCLSFCYNHSSKCLTLREYMASQLDSTNYYLSSQGKYSAYDKKVPRGPLESNARCVECQHNTTGDRCDSCFKGFFRLQEKPKTEGCRKCECNGHGNTCNEITGDTCNCNNNTETKCESKDDSIPCWRLQCSHCKEYFIGTPTKGHQCYRQMNIDREYCFDPETQKNCNQHPQALHQGRTVFFSVPPKYLNVDIRVTIDVTMGGVDVYFSNHEEIFVTEVNQKNGIHYVTLDDNLKVDGPSEFIRNKRSFPPDSSLEKRATSGSTPSSVLYYFQQRIANDLNTFITVHKKKCILLVRDVQFRLVITLPRDVHELSTSHFFIVLRSKGDRKHNVTYGSLYFRQDQPHIDLFVFFSVFFSCFFLFLAMCVMLWKMKQAFDARRNRQLRAQEMECMASRPFAKVLILIKHDYSLPQPVTFSMRKSSRPLKLIPKNMHCPNPSPLHLPPINIKEPQLCTAPIAVEPTDDGIAAIGTILVQLPGDIHAPTKLCLGSALTMRLSPPISATKGGNRSARPHVTTC